MRHVSTAGESGDLIWTHATDSATEANYGQWNLNLAAAGRYTVEVYTAASFAQSTQAKYLVHANGADAEKLIDQTASDGWQTLGDFDFAAGDQQFIHLGDNTGETPASNTQLVFDAVRLTPASSGSGSGSGGSDGSNYAGSGSDPGTQPSGCNAGGSGSGLGLVLGLGVVALRRRRR
jgi:uncharacterized protein (TIGR03382 family)